MAKSQDMRFMLNSSNIILMNHALSAQQRCVTSSQEDESLPELILPDEGTPVERSSTSITIENHKCFYFHGGCVRETKIHFAHDEEEFQQIQKGASTTPSALKRKIFVGGLPPTVDSDLLGRIFEEQFGPVEDAKVIEYEKDHQVHSQGFGLIVFKHEESVSAALQVSRVTISGKQVEIKRIVRHKKSPLPFNFDGTTPNDEQKWSHKTSHHATASDEMKADGPKSEQVSWVDRLLRGQPKVYSNDSQPPASTCFKDKSIPAWLRIFKKWIPVFLQDLSRKGSEEHYALSSLKGDFRAKFGMELDHASLGFLKLSEFMRSFPELCRLQVMPLGSSGNSNHMVIVPNFPAPHQPQSRPLTMTKSSSSANSADTSGPAFSSETESPVSCTTEETNMKDITAGNSSENHKSHGVNPKSLKFKPYELFGPQNSRDTDDKRVELEGSTLLHLEKHLVLEALSRRNGLHSFFLRDIDFYKDYMGSVLRGCCFACKQHKMIWSNFPCQHPLWCSNCKLEALKVAAGGSDHKCVVCDREVQRIDPIPWTESSQTSYRDLFINLTSTF